MRSTNNFPLFTINENNDKITEHILSLSGRILASQRFDGEYAGNYYFYNTDIRNSTMAMLDENYAAKKYYKYDEYGKEVEKGATDFINDKTFTGAVSEGGNIFYINARFYNANTGKHTYRGNARELGCIYEQQTRSVCDQCVARTFIAMLAIIQLTMLILRGIIQY